MITETILRAQDNQDQTDSSARAHRASTDMDSEPFEIIEEEIESSGDTGKEAQYSTFLA